MPPRIADRQPCRNNFLTVSECTVAGAPLHRHPGQHGHSVGPSSHGHARITGRATRAECTKIARFSAVAAAIFTAPPQNRAIFKAPRCAISSAKKIASERRFSLRLKETNLIPTAEFPAIPESAAKIASEQRCAILVHSEPGSPTFFGGSNRITPTRKILQKIWCS